MPVLPNIRWEKFCQALAQGKSATESYTLAGYRPHQGNSSRLRWFEMVQARLAELQTEAARDSAITVQSICQELDAAVAVATERGQASAMVNASALRARLAGLLTQKIEISDQRGDYDEPDSVTVARLAQYNGGRKLTEAETVEATAYFRKLFDQLQDELSQFLGALTARPINKPQNDLSSQNDLSDLRGIAGVPAFTLTNSKRR
jgi:hypothetical protein